MDLLNRPTAHALPVHHPSIHRPPNQPLSPLISCASVQRSPCGSMCGFRVVSDRRLPPSPPPPPPPPPTSTSSVPHFPRSARAGSTRAPPALGQPIRHRPFTAHQPSTTPPSHRPTTPPSHRPTTPPPLRLSVVSVAFFTALSAKGTKHAAKATKHEEAIPLAPMALMALMAPMALMTLIALMTKVAPMAPMAPMAPARTSESPST